MAGQQSLKTKRILKGTGLAHQHSHTQAVAGADFPKAFLFFCSAGQRKQICSSIICSRYVSSGSPRPTPATPCLTALRVLLSTGRPPHAPGRMGITLISLYLS
ncbi:hypothetical protein E2C01_020397 [Portunus trituberculatus]|uniref:Uncharacterized protein n=1 Tax=Portunus trituberculatus TaxID=210409 RepID=A0A5B7E1E7_PORTR|nr:hypothetical protein [Portunus trituberculatus]